MAEPLLLAGYIQQRCQNLAGRPARPLIEQKRLTLARRRQNDEPALRVWLQGPQQWIRSRLR